MTITWETANQRLEKAAQLLNNTDPAFGPGPFHVGVDLGTADIVVMVLNATGSPAACFLEWAEVVRDGVVVDYAGAVDIVRRLVGLAQEKLGVEFAGAATSFPPGTEPRLSTYILERVGLAVTAVQDEPTCVANSAQTRSDGRGGRRRRHYRYRRGPQGQGRLQRRPADRRPPHLARHRRPLRHLLQGGRGAQAAA